MRKCSLVVLFALLSACKHPLEIVGEGDIIDLNGSDFGCSLEQFQAADAACADNDVQGDYNVNYVAVPRLGWVFTGWEGVCSPKKSMAPHCFIEAPALLVAAWDQLFPDTPVLATRAVFEEASQGTINGLITFDSVTLDAQNGGLDYDNIIEKPARGVTVEVRAASDNSVLGTGETDGSGQYAIAIDWLAQSVFLRVGADMTRQGSPNWQFTVTDNTSNNAVYVIESNTFDGDETTTRSLHAASGWDGSSYTTARSAAPFALLDTVYSAVELIMQVDNQQTLPPLDIRWSVNNSTASGNLEDGNISTSFFQGSTDEKIAALYIVGKADDDTDEYDSPVVAHEFGHYVEGELSRSETVGGEHSGGDVLDIRVAFSEGWGTAFGAMVNETEIYYDTSGPAQSSGFTQNVESEVLGKPGWWNEDSVTGLIYDLYDSNNEAGDKVTVGAPTLLRAMMNGPRTSDSLTSIHSFLTAFLHEKPRLRANTLSLAATHGVLADPMNVFGSAETNLPSDDSSGVESLLPLYRDLAISGASLEVCSTVNHDPGETGNKAGIYRFLTVNIEFDGDYEFEALRASGREGADPDMLLYRRGTVVARGDSIEVDSETLRASNLSRGTYVISLYDFNNVSPNEFGPPGSVCFDVTAISL